MGYCRLRFSPLSPQSTRLIVSVLVRVPVPMFLPAQGQEVKTDHERGRRGGGSIMSTMAFGSLGRAETATSGWAGSPSRER